MTTTIIIIMVMLLTNQLCLHRQVRTWWRRHRLLPLPSRRRGSKRAWRGSSRRCPSPSSSISSRASSPSKRQNWCHCAFSNASDVARTALLSVGSRNTRPRGVDKKDWTRSQILFVSLSLFWFFWLFDGADADFWFECPKWIALAGEIGWTDRS